MNDFTPIRQAVLRPVDEAIAERALSRLPSQIFGVMSAINPTDNPLEDGVRPVIRDLAYFGLRWGEW